MHTHIFLDIYFLHLPLEGQARQEEAKGFHILFKRERPSSASLGWPSDDAGVASAEYLYS